MSSKGVLPPNTRYTWHAGNGQFHPSHKFPERTNRLVQPKEFRFRAEERPKSQSTSVEQPSAPVSAGKEEAHNETGNRTAADRDLSEDMRELAALYKDLEATRNQVEAAHDKADLDAHEINVEDVLTELDAATIQKEQRELHNSWLARMPEQLNQHERSVIMSNCRKHLTEIEYRFIGNLSPQAQNSACHQLAARWPESACIFRDHPVREGPLPNVPNMVFAPLPPLIPHDAEPSLVERVMGLPTGFCSAPAPVQGPQKPPMPLRAAGLTLSAEAVPRPVTIAPAIDPNLVAHLKLHLLCSSRTVVKQASLVGICRSWIHSKRPEWDDVTSLQQISGAIKLAFHSPAESLELRKATSAPEVLEHIQDQNRFVNHGQLMPSWSERFGRKLWNIFGSTTAPAILPPRD